MRDGLDDVGAGDEHVARLLHHQDEVGDGGRIDGAAGARSHDRGDLRDHARGQRVAKKDVGVAAEGDDAFLNARAAGVVQADDRRAVLHRQIHDLHDLRGVRFRERSAEDGEVLREGIDQPPLHSAVAGDDAVAGDALLVHPEIAGAMDDELIELLERSRIEQQRDALARGELALGVLTIDARLPATELTLLFAAFELLQLFVVRHELSSRLSALSSQRAPAS